MMRNHTTVGGDLKAVALSSLQEVERVLGHTVKFDLSLLMGNSVTGDGATGDKPAVIAPTQSLHGNAARPWPVFSTFLIQPVSLF